MTNLLNSIIANQSIHKQTHTQSNGQTFTFDSKGKVRPLEDKAILLPSRIFGSPIEYAKDLKQDVINIGRAAKGKANDHELGRINDLAMKLGSLALASYLFVKNPLKMSKTMEFVGLGTFFGSMALWPKLAIQAPLKARTGVDIHQKYIDSQGRKKMLMQDPQYDLTDLYSREDLDRMGKKLGVSENLADRDYYIKQRAKKVGVQGNTLWMMTAGAAPVMSGLFCNVLERPIAKGYELADLFTSSLAMKNSSNVGLGAKFKNTVNSKALDKFLVKNASKTMDEGVIKQLANYLGKGVQSATIGSAIEQELASMKNTVVIDESFVRKTLASHKGLENIMSSLTKEQSDKLAKAINDKSIESISKILSSTATTKKEQNNLLNTISRALSSAQKIAEKPTVAQVTDKIKSLNSSLRPLANGKTIIDRYTSARVGDKAGTYLANQWGRVGKKLIKSLKLDSTQLKKISEGNMEVLSERLSSLASNPKQYDKAINQLVKLINKYEAITGDSFIEQVKNKTSEMCVSAGNILESNGFEKVSAKLKSNVSRGSIENVMTTHAKERALGAQASFYRLLQALDLYKRAQTPEFTKQVKSVYSKVNGTLPNDVKLRNIVDACKNLVLNATTADYVEKLKSNGFNLSKEDYYVVMKILFDETSSTVETSSALEKSLGAEKAKTLLSGFNKYKADFMGKIANWKNGMTPQLAACTLSDATNSMNAVERNNIVAKPIKTLIQDVAKQTYNSKKWLKIFGISMGALTVITLLAGLAIGRKDKVEKQKEEESKVNG